MTMNTEKESRDIDYERLVEEETLIFEATELIAELLDDQQVTRKELADRLGRSKGYVTQVLAGDRNMTLKTLATLAFALEHRVELSATPLGMGDSGIDGGQVRPPVARVRVGLGEFDRRARCCDSVHPPRFGCTESRLSGSSRAIWRSPAGPTPTAPIQESDVGRPTELDQVAG